MKVIVAGKREGLLRLPIVALAAAILVASFVLLFSRVGGGEEDESRAVSGDFSSAAVLGALENFGAASAEQAVEVWSQGVAARNCATQYSVMSAALRERYLEVVGDELLLPAGASSVDSWYISDVREEDGVTTATILFTISDGEGESVAASAELTLEEEGEYVVISSLEVESPLYEFTGVGA